jgi:hypothetical protein
MGGRSIIFISAPTPSRMQNRDKKVRNFFIQDAIRRVNMMVRLRYPSAGEMDN